jgi:hypothetical protein
MLKKLCLSLAVVLGGLRTVHQVDVPTAAAA